MADTIQYENYTLDIAGQQVANNFKVTMDLTNKVTLYGHSVTPFDAIVMRGLMPDNNVASLKLLKCIGGQLAKLERQEAQEAQNAAKKSVVADESVASRTSSEPPNIIGQYYQSLPPHIAFTRQVDIAINAHTARLLQVMGKLDQARSKNMVMTEDERQALLKEIKGVMSGTKVYINELYQKYKDQPIGSTIKYRLDKMTKELNSQITFFENDPVFSKTAPVAVDTAAHQRLFRAALEQYESLEGIVSTWEGARLNQSCTEAYQDASKSLQNHLYSEQKPDDMHLWRLPDMAQVTLDTALYDDKFERDKLLFTLAVGLTYPLETYENNAAQIRNRQNPLANQEEPTEGIKSAPIQAATPLENLATNINSGIQAWQAQNPGKNIENIDEADKTTIITQAFQKSLGERAYTLPGARPLHIHESTDLYSAVGHAAETLSSYFAQEMAAKHPGLTFAFFGLTAATFGASALVATHTAAHLGAEVLNVVGAAFHKASMGKLSSASVQHALLAAEKNWASFTHADGLMKRLIMDVIGLPKLTFMMSELLISNRVDLTTLDKIVAQFNDDELLFKTDEQKMAKALMQSATTAIGLGLIVSGGLLVHYLASLPAIQHVGTVHGSLSAVDKIMDMTADQFTQCAKAHGLVPEIIAVTSAIFAVKAAALVGGKVYLVGKQVLKTNEDPAVVQHMETLGALYMLYLDDQDSFTKVQQNITPKGMWSLIQQSARKLRGLRPDLFDNNPLNNEAFWNAFMANDAENKNKAEITPNQTDMEVASKPGIVKRIVGGLWNRLIGPPIGALFTLITTLFVRPVEKITGVELLKGGTVDREMKYQAAKLGRSLAGIGLFGWNGLKMGGNAIYRTAFLGLKYLAAAERFSALCLNAILKGNIGLGFAAFFRQVGSMLGRGVLRLASGIVNGVSELLRVAAAGVLGVLASIGGIILLPWVAAGVLINSVVSANNITPGENKSFTGTFKDEFNKSTKGMLDKVLGMFVGIKNLTAPISSLPTDFVSAPLDNLRKKLHDQDDIYEQRLLEVEGAGMIMAHGDEMLDGLNKAQAWGKNTVGRALNTARTVFVRSAEEEIQIHGATVKDTTITSVALINQRLGTCHTQPMEKESAWSADARDGPALRTVDNRPPSAAAVGGDNNNDDNNDDSEQRQNGPSL